MGRDDEIERRENGGKSHDENAHRHRHDVPVRIGRAVRGVEGPAGVHAAGDRRVERENAPRDKDVPAQQIQARERHVARPDHQRQQEVAQHGGDRGNQEEPHHHDAMQREKTVVGFRGHEIALRRHQLEAHHRRRPSADEEEHRDRQEVEDADALVVVGRQPGLQAVPGIEVVGLALGRRGRRRVDGRAGDQGGSGTHGEEGMGWLCAAAGWEGCERLLM